LEIALEREKKSSKESIYNLQKSIIKANEELDNAKASGDDEEVTRLQASLQESQNDLDSSAKRIDELEAQLKTNTIDVITAEPMVIEKIPEETQKELEQLRKNISGRSIARFRVCFEDLQETFREQLELMPEIKKSDPIIYEKCKGKMLELINSMAERL
jgi:predicted  nucleic acid-binding Zn-ribbon protein